MALNKLNRKHLEEMIENNEGEPQTHVIKFYSDECPMCHALREYYADLSEDIRGVKFHIFNMKAGKGLEERLRFRGVPTIGFVRTGPEPKISMMPDPQKPNHRTWYRVDEIKEFIRRQLQK